MDPKNTVMIVDNDENILTSLKKILRRDYNVFTARDGRAAIHLIDTESVQVVLANCSLPGISGGDLLASIEQKYPEIVRLMYADKVEPDILMTAINSAHIYRFLLTPLQPDDLRQVIQDACEKHELAVRNRQMTQELVFLNAALEQRVNQRTTDLIQANQKLLEVNHKKDDFISTVSHDVRSPLNNILLAAGILQEHHSVFPAAQNQSLMQGIIDSCKRMTNTIGSLVEQARMDSRQIELERSDILACDVTQDCLKALEIEALLKKTSVDL
jgi:response regulator RpfG family c-di-GMP phosphodiesterase